MVDSVCAMLLIDALQQIGTLLISRQILNHDESQNPWLEWIGKTVDELDIALTYNLIFNAALLVRAGVGCAVTLDKLPRF